jgi:hypothetical protein
MPSKSLLLLVTTDGGEGRGGGKWAGGFMDGWLHEQKMEVPVLNSYNVTKPLVRHWS